MVSKVKLGVKSLERRKLVKISIRHPFGSSSLTLNTEEASILIGELHAAINRYSSPLNLEKGKRYLCIKDVHYDTGQVMFTNGLTYVADENFRGIGLICNDGGLRTQRDILYELTTEFFEPVKC